MTVVDSSPFKLSIFVSLACSLCFGVLDPNYLVTINLFVVLLYLVGFCDVFVLVVCCVFFFSLSP